MRAIYNLKILKFENCAPIIKKIFGTFIAFCIIFYLIAALLFFGILQQNFSQEDTLFILKKISVIWLFFTILLLFALWVLLKNSISPLIELINLSKNLKYLQEIELPTNLSQEVTELYKIMNSSILRLKELQSQTIESEKNAAIASTIQMLAHDVRKPFSLLRIAIKILINEKDSTQIDFALKKVIPEVDLAISKVEGMLIDLMEIGSTSKNLYIEPVSPISLIQSSITENFRIYNKADINLSYHFSHFHMLNANQHKMERVFSNILVNAMQAINFNGNIWFRTTEFSDGENFFIEFCIGNDNSFIPEEHLKNLFKMFYTNNKKNGTGLGLAIANKIIKDHGGKIWCTSVKNQQFPKGKVEFWFTIPIAEGFLEKRSTCFALHSSEITKFDLTFSTEKIQELKNNEIQYEIIENKIINLSSKLCRPFHILIIDDESIYRKILLDSIVKIHKIHKVIKIFQAEGSDQALLLIKNQQFDLIITDIDMGENSLNGFELVKKIKNKNILNDALICIHSNFLVTNTHHIAFENRPNIFIPKPIFKEHLLELILLAGLKKNVI